MIRKHLFLILMLVASLFTLAACGDDDSNDNDRPDFNSSSGGMDASSSGMTSSGEMDASSSGTTSSGEMDASSSGTSSSGTDASSSGTSSSGMDTTSSGTDTDMMMMGETCEDAPTFTGQIGIPPVPEAGSHEGGVYTNTAYDAGYDSGIAATIAAVNAALDAETDPVMFPYVADINVAITEATVTATSYNDRGNRVFWLADGNAAIQVFFDQEATENFPPFTVKVGQKLSFTVAQAQINYGAPSIVAIDTTVGWAADNETAGENDVYVSEHTGGPALSADQLHEMVRVKGTLTGLLGNDATGACGGSSICYELTYGDGLTTEFRTSSTFVEVGDCVTFVGPVGVFSNAPQLNVDNFDFYWEIQPGN